ncbi:NAD(P)H-dependent oxidoreductase [Streptomyces sp. NPDC046759]|uniref:NADPH-dependent FMN reductase n=1 Tax=Streptomyces sp. NPDC046759 TaxID=3155019 RepID=UPI00340F1825
MTRIGIIIGSTRPGRNGDKVARWVRSLAAEHAGDAAEFDIVDLKDHALPLFDEAVPALRAPGVDNGSAHVAKKTKAWLATCPRFNIPLKAA